MRARNELRRQSEEIQRPDKFPAIRFEGKTGIGPKKRKVHIFGKTVEPVQDSERRPPVEGRRIEKPRLPQAEERDVLDDLPQCVLGLLGRHE